MPKASAGLVMYRLNDGQLEVLLVHLGGPFWAKKDVGAWFIPKGEIAAGEDELSAARREFEEETGIQPAGNFQPLGKAKHQRGGKTVVAWAFEGQCDPRSIKSNVFEMEWPPRSGKRRQFPEVDRADWFTVEAARNKLHQGEFPLIERLQESLGDKSKKP